MTSPRDDIAAGTLADNDTATCPGCSGYGYIPDDFDEPENYTMCLDCGGSGYWRGAT